MADPQTDGSPASSPLPKGPLYAFALPPSVLSTLQLRTVSAAPEPSPQPEPPSPEPGSPQDQPDVQPTLGGGAGRFVCSTTGARFDTVEELRAHLRSDWYRYCVKLRMAGKEPVSEEQFDELMDGLSSLSGSEDSGSSEGEGSASDTDAVATLLKKQRLSRPGASASAGADEAEEAEEAAYNAQRALARTPLVWFSLTAEAPVQLGLYRALFPSNLLRASGASADYLGALRNLQLEVAKKGKVEAGEGGPRRWTLIMIGGGHFAGMVISLVPRVVKRGKKVGGGEDWEVGEVLRQKTFHRYTTRRKQGGAQSSNDQAKGNAKSAGAQLRRYNEQALADDIRNLLAEWKDDVDASERIFVRASSSANRRVLFGDQEGALDQKDDRIRAFPFPTRRPTHNELLRCFTELTRPKTTFLSASALQAQDDAWLASLAPRPKPKPSAPAPAPAPKAMPVKLSAEEEAFHDRWARLVDIVRRGRQDALVSFLDKHGAQLLPSLDGIDTDVDIDRAFPPFLPGDARTLLQLAAQSDHPALTQYLLLTRRADPTRGPTVAYDLAPSRETRNVFRRAMADDPGRCDWVGAARVPSALTSEMEERQEEKGKERRRGLKERMKERQASRPAPEPVLDEPAPVLEPPAGAGRGGPQKLGGAGSGESGVAGLTPEMRARVERERRARAAEARMAALGLGGKK